MKLHCLHCGVRIWKRSTNAKKNVAKCDSCGHRQNLAYLIEKSKQIGDYDPKHPPFGARLSRNGLSWEVRGSNWSWRHGFVLLACTVLLGGFISEIEPMESNTSTAGHVVGFVLFPPVWVATFGLLFGIFLAFGGTTIRSDGSSLVIFEGVGGIGRTQRLRNSDVQLVRQDYVGNRRSSSGYAIVVVGDEIVSTGHFLNHHSQRYVLQTLRGLLHVPLRPKTRRSRGGAPVQVAVTSSSAIPS